MDNWGLGEECNGLELQETVLLHCHPLDIFDIFSDDGERVFFSQELLSLCSSVSVSFIDLHFKILHYCVGVWSCFVSTMQLVSVLLFFHDHFHTI